MGIKKMEIIRVILKIIMWFLIIEFSCNFVMQTISYSFYKKAKDKTDITYTPQYVQMTGSLTGYGYNLEVNATEIILFFGGSSYTAYNSVGSYAGAFNCPFIAADYYGTQKSRGKMNIKSMQQSATDLYDWAKRQYPEHEIVIIGHSYGTGMATYLASKYDCKALVLAAAYRNLADLYNKMTPVFWGPFEVFITNNIEVSKYAKTVACPVYVIGSESDTTLSSSLQRKVADCFSNAQLRIFENVNHENYMVTENVVEYIKSNTMVCSVLLTKEFT